jgi:hypothetical protein
MYPISGGPGFNGYHLFGNSNMYYPDHVKTDHWLESLCEDGDEIDIENETLPHMTVTLENENLDSLGTAELFESDFFEFEKCDTISLSNKSENLRIYPNPSNDMINIDFKDDVDQIRIIVHDLMGKSIFNEDTINTDGSTISLNIREWNNGVYLLAIQTKDGVYTRKFVKM